MKIYERAKRVVVLALSKYYLLTVSCMVVFLLLMRVMEWGGAEKYSVFQLTFPLWGPAVCVIAVALSMCVIVGVCVLTYTFCLWILLRQVDIVAGWLHRRVTNVARREAVKEAINRRNEECGLDEPPCKIVSN